MQDQQLGDKLGQTARHRTHHHAGPDLGMVEGGPWLYATATPEQVVPSPSDEIVDASKPTADSAVSQLIGALSGDFVGTSGR